MTYITDLPPKGEDNEIQFNDQGELKGEPGLTWDGSTLRSSQDVSAGGKLVLKSDGTGSSSIQAARGSSADISYTLPGNSGTSGQVLSVSSTPGTLEWSTPEANTTTPGGPNYSIQFNNGPTNLGGSSKLTWVSDTTLSVNGSLSLGPSSNLIILPNKIESYSGGDLVLENLEDTSGVVVKGDHFTVNSDSNSTEFSVDSVTGMVTIGNSLILDAKTNISTGYTLKFPSTSGNAGQVLSTSGVNGDLSWVNPLSLSSVSGGVIFSPDGTSLSGTDDLTFSGGVLDINGNIKFSGSFGKLLANNDKEVLTLSQNTVSVNDTGFQLNNGTHGVTLYFQNDGDESSYNLYFPKTRGNPGQVLGMGSGSHPASAKMEWYSVPTQSLTTHGSEGYVQLKGSGVYDMDSTNYLKWNAVDESLDVGSLKIHREGYLGKGTKVEVGSGDDTFMVTPTPASSTGYVFKVDTNGVDCTSLISNSYLRIANDSRLEFSNSFLKIERVSNDISYTNTVSTSGHIFNLGDVSGNTYLRINRSDSNPCASITSDGELSLYRQQSTFKSSFKPSTSQAVDISYTLPSSLGTSGQVLTLSNNTGNLSWQDSSGGGGSTVSGPNNSIQFTTDSSTLSGSASLTFDGTHLKSSGLKLNDILTVSEVSGNTEVSVPSGNPNILFRRGNNDKMFEISNDSNKVIVGDTSTSSGGAVLRSSGLEKWSSNFVDFSLLLSGSNVTLENKETSGSVIVKMAAESSSNSFFIQNGSNDVIFRVKSDLGETLTGDLVINNYTQSKNVTLKVSDSTTSNYVLTLPTTIGTSGQVLSTGSTPGTMEWVTPSGGGGGTTPGGVEGSIQINSSNAFDGSDDLLWSGTDLEVNGGLNLKSSASTGITLSAPSSGNPDYALTLPTSSGSLGQVLTTSGVSGVLSWSTPSSGGGGGSSTECPILEKKLFTNLSSTHSLPNKNYYSGAYSPDLDVIVMITNTEIYSSHDKGVTWELRTKPSNINVMEDVIWGKDKFVICSRSGTERIATSVDGISWISRSVSQDNWYGLTYSPELDRYVCVGAGNTNRIMSSPDAITWTNRTSPASNTWKYVAWSGTLFAAVSTSGTGNRAMTSPDGFTWTIRTTPVDNSWYDLKWSDNLQKFVAANYTSSTQTMVGSADGETWSMIEMGNVAKNFYTVLDIPDVGTAIFSSDGSMNFSKDGVEWEQIEMFSLSETNYRTIKTALLFPNDNKIFLSTTNSGIFKFFNFGTNNSGIVYSDSVKTPDLSIINTSGKGATLKISNDTENSYELTLPTKQIPKGNVLACPDTDGELKEAYFPLGMSFDQDGKGFVTRDVTDQLGGITLGVSGADYSPDLGKWVVVSTTSSNNKIGVTSDLENWTFIDPPQINGWRDVKWCSEIGIFVACCDSGTNRIITSEDGENWTFPTGSLTNQYHKVKELGGSVVAGRDFTNVKYAHSSDGGVTWYDRTFSTSLTQNWDAVAYSEELSLGIMCRASTTTSNIAKTVNAGLSWTFVTSASLPSGDWRDLIFENGEFVVVGGYDLIYTSPDGENWTQKTVSYDDGLGSRYLNKIIYIESLGVYVMSTSNSLIFSNDLSDWKGVDRTKWQGTTIPISSNNLSWSEKHKKIVTINSYNGVTSLSPEINIFSDPFVSIPTANFSKVYLGEVELTAETSGNVVRYSLPPAPSESGMVLSSTKISDLETSIEWSEPFSSSILSLQVYDKVKFDYTYLSQFIYSPFLGKYFFTGTDPSNSSVELFYTEDPLSVTPTPVDPGLTSSINGITNFATNDVCLVASTNTNNSAGIIRSVDGVNWTEEISNIADYDYWTKIVWCQGFNGGNGRFIAIPNNDSDNCVAYSDENGLNWTRGALSYTDFRPGDIFYSEKRNTAYVTSQAGNDRLAYSEDGINWTVVSTSMDSKSLYKAAYSEKFDTWVILTGQTSTSIAYYRGSGTSVLGGLQYIYTRGNINSSSYMKIVYDSDSESFIVISGVDDLLHVSSDGGETWTSHESPDSTLGTFSVEKAGKYVILLSNSTGLTGFLRSDVSNIQPENMYLENKMVCSDLILRDAHFFSLKKMREQMVKSMLTTWIPCEIDSSVSTSVYHTSSVYSEKKRKWFAVNGHTGNNDHRILDSVDGKSFTPSATLPSTSIPFLKIRYFKNSGEIIAVGNNTGNICMAYYDNSTDTWTNCSQSTEGGRYVTDVCYTGYYYIATTSGGTHTSKILRSINKQGSFNHITTPSLSVGMSCIAYSPHLNMTVAMAYSGTTYLTSSNNSGSGWSSRVTENKSYTDIIWCDMSKLFITCYNTGGTIGRISYSPDGINWTEAETPLKTFRKLLYVEELGVVIAVCYNNSRDSVFVSFDGGYNWGSIHITNMNIASTSAGLVDISYSNHHNGFVMISNNLSNDVIVRTAY